MTQIRLRQDTATNWSSSSSITPALGEPCIQTDGEKHFKIGDGTNKFNNLPYYVKSTELGDLDDLTTENKDTFVDAMNEIVANGGNKDLSNLTITGENKLQAVKAYASNGEMLQDADGLSFVKNYAHSTFDRSKFTVVGSPNITDDGIASGFSNSNYINCGSYNFKKGKSFKIKGNFKCSTVTEESNRFLISCNGMTSNNNLYVNIGTAGRFTFHIGDADVQAMSSPNTIEAGVFYDIECLYDGNTTATLKWKKHTESIFTTISAIVTADFNFTADLVIGKVSSGDWHFIGETDLKHFSITVDGVEVFNGNRTGIDTIKPDNYTVVGTPTISADGIASGFSDSNYLTKTFANIITGNYDLNIKFAYNALGSTQRFLSLITSNYLYSIYQQNSSLIVRVPNVAGSSFVERTTANLSNHLGEYVYLTIKVRNNMTVTPSVSFDGINYTEYTPITFAEDNPNLSIASIYKLGAQNFTGSIDLNAFKIYVDGNLVYQPCLKIPYTESKTGSKIVDSIYRDRVNDMAEQFGYAPYYTLQEDKKGDYTVVGTPTISADGIASGFSENNNYVLKILNLSNASSLRIEFANIYCPLQSTGRHKAFFEIQPSSSFSYFGLRLYRNALIGGGLEAAYPTSSGGATVVELKPNFSTAENFSGYVEIKNNILSFVINDTACGSYELTTEQLAYIFTNVNLSIGAVTHSGSGQYLADGSIDLNAFKVYVDNKLAYEAVIDPNFTLPQVELYGLIGQRTLRDSYRNGINYWELYSNRDLEQGGSCTSGVEVTFARPFADTNYVLSVPYSAKSSTAFTPTQTGDWIAKGKGIL